jgi:hypothetical protein
VARRRLAAAVAWLCAAMVSISVAEAQVAAPAASNDEQEGHIALQETVFSRARPEFETEGLQLEDVLWEPLKRLGFIAHNAEAPAIISSGRAFVNVTAETEYDDNIFRTKGNRKSDIIYRLKPSVDINSDWENGALSLLLQGDFSHYGSFTDEDGSDILGRLRGFTEFGLAGEVAGELILSRRKEPRGAIEDPGAVFSPTFVLNKEGALRATYGFPDSFFAEAETRLRQLTFTSENLDRSSDDRMELELGTRGGWRAGSGSTLYIEPKYTTSMYDRTTDGFGLQRDAKKYQVSGGVEWDVSPLTYIDAKVGYFTRDFSEPTFNSVSGINYAASITWNPSEFITVKGQFRRDIEDVILQNTSSAVVTVYRLGLEYELLDNVLLHLDGAYETAVFNELARNDKVYAVATGVRYLINEYFFAGLRLSRTDRESTDSSLEYTDTRAMVYFGLKLCCTGDTARQRGGP